MDFARTQNQTVICSGTLLAGWKLQGVHHTINEYACVAFMVHCSLNKMDK